MSLIVVEFMKVHQKFLNIFKSRRYLSRYHLTKKNANARRADEFFFVAKKIGHPIDITVSTLNEGNCYIIVHEKNS